jgi:ABC-type antimicrobial peptide transport system permease subunit
MLDTIGKLGIGGGIGVLIGIVMVLWVKPTTNGGTAILIVIPVIACTIISGIISALRGKAKPPEDDKFSGKRDD